MLHSFKLKNFRSFADEAEISFVVGKQAPQNDQFFASQVDPEIRLSKAIACLGPNASGKTNLLNALACCHWLMFDAGDVPELEGMDEPFASYAYDFASTIEPTEFQLELEVAGRRYRYQVACDPKAVIREQLEVAAGDKYQTVFSRGCHATALTLGPGARSTAAMVSAMLGKRPYATAFSVLRKFGDPIVMPVAQAWASCVSNISMHGKIGLKELVPQAADYFASRPEAKRRAVDFMKKFDATLDGIEITTVPVERGGSRSEQRRVAFATRKVKGKIHGVLLHEEARSTQRLLTLAYQLLAVLEQGGCAIMDTPEADLHPHVLQAILKLFFSPETNPKNAQILFTTHVPEVLRELDKTQVILVEKDRETCRSQAWRLDEMQGVRRDDNLYAKYMAGAYGAIPEL
jgi:hypothetical protein